MRNKKHLIIVILLALVFPFIVAFTSYNMAPQTWWQRRKQQEPPMEFNTLEDNQGYKIIINFKKGKSHNHPLMAFWVEDMEGNYVQSLYVAQSIAEGYYRHGDASSGRWQPGPLRRPAALPYWGHKRGIKAADGYYIPTQDDPMPDAVTGATPKADFILTTFTIGKELKEFKIMMEINQSWDWNQYWHNNKFPDDDNYKTSSQPALVYEAVVNINNLQPEYNMQAIGHSHWSGANGNLYDDLSTITTALDIADTVTILINNQ